MNAIAMVGDRRMTVKEVADALGTAESTIRNKVAELFPEAVQNGKATYLTEEQVNYVKKSIVPRDLTLKSKLENATTAIEIHEMTVKVIEYHVAENARLKRELAEAGPKIASAEAIAKCETSMSITEAAKHFGLHPKLEVFPYLRARGYLIRDDMPSQSAIDAGYLALRQNPDRFGVCHPQAVVLTWQLENWRAHVIRGIKRWTHEGVAA
jgi:phage antirepressor YoqD-like protein